MKSRPILFSGPMVRALLAGTKTQTRRIVKREIINHHSLERDEAGAYWVEAEDGDHYKVTDWCPYGQPGDQLWVRETWARVNVAQFTGEPQFVYPVCDTLTDYGGPWRPSIHMPRAASRIALEITGVRVERLQEISEHSAINEGIELKGHVWKDYRTDGGWSNPINSYASLWAKINGTEGPGSWDANPWVWVVEFKRVAP
jgi:hypothetical protein